jgi:hypothetical protein
LYGRWRPDMILYTLAAGLIGKIPKLGDNAE